MISTYQKAKINAQQNAIATSIVLVGYANAGKTSLGQKLALEFDCPFYDTDAMLTAQSGYATVREAYQALGKETFRQLEHQQLLALNLECKQVIATGGGVVERPDNLAILQSLGMIVYLAWPWPILLQRQVLNPGVFYHQDQKQSDHWQQRHRLYSQWAEEICDLTREDEDQAFMKLYDKIRGTHGQ